MKNKKIFFILPFVLISLLTGIYAGWIRIGWQFPVIDAIAHHGLLMVGSFLGTLIIVERIVALKKLWLYLIPIINGLSLPAFILKNDPLALSLLVAGSIGLIMIYAIIYYQYREYYVLIMLVGGIFLLFGNILILIGKLYLTAVPFWIGFILFTIVGERIDLGKFLPRKKYKNTLLWISLSLFVLGLLLPFHFLGHILMGAGMVSISLWLLKYDIVNKSMQSHGIHQYIGITLFSGYLWLMATGILAIMNLQKVFYYDALLHSFFLGFTFLMIFAHAPIIFPGVAGINIKPFHPTLYVWVILLNIFLSLRIIADLFFMYELRKISGMVNGLVILGFFLTLAVLIRKEYKILT